MKRLIICADGTWNIRDQTDEKTGKRRPTNVTKMARAIRPRAANGTDQVVFYHDGLGTSGPMDKMSGGAFGTGGADRVEQRLRDRSANTANTLLTAATCRRGSDGRD